MAGVVTAYTFDPVDTVALIQGLPVVVVVEVVVVVVGNRVDSNKLGLADVVDTEIVEVVVVFGPPGHVVGFLKAWVLDLVWMQIRVVACRSHYASPVKRCFETFVLMYKFIIIEVK